MRGRTILFGLLALTYFTVSARADEARTLVDEAVKAAGGADKIPKIFRWQETWFLGDSKTANPREAIVKPPGIWGQGGKNIATGNADRTEKTYLVWVWTLAPLLEPDSKLMLLPESMVGGRPIQGVRLTRDQQKDIDVYFDKETKRLARIDWRTYQIDFDDWKEADGFKYPAQSYVRRKDGPLHLRTEFLVLERLTELPKELQP